jgi:hypothetical protein
MFCTLLEVNFTNLHNYTERLISITFFTHYCSNRRKMKRKMMKKMKRMRREIDAMV